MDEDANGGRIVRGSRATNDERRRRRAMMDLFSEGFRRDPFPAYDRLRSAAPVLHEPATGLWMLSDYDGVKRALTDHDAFSSVVSPPPSKPSQWLIFMDAERHAKLRALVSRAFTPRAVAALEPRIRQLSRGLLDAALHRGEMELAGDFSIPLPLMVIAEMLGAPVADWPTFRRWGDGLMALIHTLGNAAAAEQAVATFAGVHAEMEVYLAGLLTLRRRAPADDLLTRLLEAEVDGDRLGDEEILGFFQLLLVAGHETTTNLIDNAVLSFVERPDQLARVRAEPALLPAAIEEVLRFRSPVQTSFRVTRRDVELRGQVIPAGRRVLAVIGAANRDPAHFARPNDFDVGRDPNPHLAFGHGIHYCLGTPLSRLEARVALGHLLDATTGLRLASDEPWEPRAGFHVHGPSGLHVRFEAVGAA
jgi:cytochrome P450